MRFDEGWTPAVADPVHDFAGDRVAGEDVVTVDLERLPAEGAPLVGDRLHVEDDRAVGLDAVAIDEGDKVSFDVIEGEKGPKADKVEKV